VYQYAGITGQLHDLNFGALYIYAKDEYPDKEHIKQVFCFHHHFIKIVRREDYYTLEPYWEGIHDCMATAPRSWGFDRCYQEDCGGYRNISPVGNPMDFYEVSRPLFYDISTAFYSKNRYRICRSSPKGFKPFLDLPGYAVRMLTSLTIRLDGEPLDSIELDGNWERIEQLIPMRLYSRHGKTAFKEWEKVVRRLSELILPSRLNLYLIANCPNMETAEAILKPLDALPTLKGCGLFLNKERKPELIELIQTTAKRLTTPPDDKEAKPFRYLDLPLELRYRILEHSDLVAATDLEWKPKLQSLGPLKDPHCSCVHDWSYNDFIRVGHLPHCRPAYDTALSSFLFDANEFLEQHICSNCDTLSTTNRTLYTYECGFKYKYSAYSSNCARPRRIHPLFLVSRQARQDALPIFFQQNRFLITPPGVHYSRLICSNLYGFRTYQRTIPMPRYELSIFLSSLPSMALRYVRRLEWLLPQFSNYRAAPESAYFDYLGTIDMMAQAMHLPLLTLVLNLRVSMRDSEAWAISYPFRRQRDGDMYNKILLPLQRLHGLKDCFIYLKRIVEYIDDFNRWAYYDSDEMRYEKEIMGQDYDSAARGKPWMERYESRTDWEPRKVTAYGHYEHA
jgi:hypothetical protein